MEAKRRKEKRRGGGNKIEMRFDDWAPSPTNEE
jgi:hypothetical protein